MAVLVVSWVLALLTLFGASFQHEARTDLRLTRVEREAAQSRALARSGIAVVCAILRETQGNGWDAPGEGWDRNPGLARMTLGSGAFSVGYVPATEGGPSVYGCQDEGRRIPWEDLDLVTLQRLPGMSAAAAAAIDRYRAAGGTRPDPLLLELDRVDGAARAALAEYVTVHPCLGANINTSPREVLVALGIGEDGVQQILARRDGPDGLPGTEDDRPFTSLLVPDGGLQDCRLTSEDAAKVSILARKEHLVTTSNTFRISARGWVEGVAAYCQIDAVLVREPSGDFRRIEWRESWGS